MVLPLAVHELMLDRTSGRGVSYEYGIGTRAKAGNGLGRIAGVPQISIWWRATAGAYCYTTVVHRAARLLYHTAVQRQTFRQNHRAAIRAAIRVGYREGMRSCGSLEGTST